MLATLALLLAQDRPTPEEVEVVRTRTAYVLDQGEVELDAIGSFLRFEEDGERQDVAALVVEVEGGLTDWLMLEVEIPYLFLDPGPRGWGDAEIELKAGWPIGDDLHVAVGTEVSILTGDEDKGLGEEEAELGFFAAASRRWGPVAGHLQIGAEAAHGSKPEYGLAAALEAEPWGPALSLYLAVNGEIEPGEGPGWSVVPGFEMRLEEPEIEFGAGFPVGLTDEAEEWGVIVNVELEF